MVDKLKERLKGTLPPKRYTHSVGVAKTARAYAEQYGEDPEKAYLAGLLHDCAKYMKQQEMLVYADAHGIQATPLERELPELLHAEIGARIAREEYGVEDEAVLAAMRHHIYGVPGMPMLDLLVNLADYTEPGRNFPDAELLRKEAKKDPRRELLHAFQGTLRLLLDGGALISPPMIETYNALVLELRKEE